MTRGKLLIPIFLGLLTFLLVNVPISGAYSVGEGGGTGLNFGNPPNFGDLLAPAQDFFQSIGSIDTSIVPHVVGSSQPFNPGNPLVANWVQGIFQRFDGWLYGIAGFHILGIFTAILAIFSWILGAVKNAIDWLLNIL